MKYFFILSLLSLTIFSCEKDKEVPTPKSQSGDTCYFKTVDEAVNCNCNCKVNVLTEDPIGDPFGGDF